MIRRLAFLGSLVATASLALAGSATGHELDHPAPGLAATTPPAPTFLSSPAGKWELVATIPTGNPHTDLDFFAQGKEIYASVGTLAIGPNAGGQTIVRLTENGEVTSTSPRFVSAHPSAACASEPSRALGLQHDVEATPKGNVIFNTTFPAGVKAATGDAQLLLDATDAKGRCHDAATFGALGSDAQGGIEIIDITDVENPLEIALTSHIGQAHTVNVDPKRPHIAFVVTSDTVGVTCDADDTSCTRANGSNLDGFEVLDISTCLGSATPLVKRSTCVPQVYRYRYPSALVALGHTVDALAGCHEVEIYPDDRLTCASINATLVFDVRGAFDNRGTPTDYTDDKPRGTPLPCRVRNSSSTGPFTTGAKIVDCVDRDPASAGNDLDLANYTAPSLEGVVHVGTVFHQGRGGPNKAPADVDVSHEAELSASGRLLLVTDERGGGVSPPGATCVTSPADNPDGNGGIHAYRMDRLLQTSPNDPAVAWRSYADKPGGGKAIYRAPINTGPQGSLCTSHVFHQIPGQNRIFMGWYSQGTQVVDFVEHSDGTVEFRQAGYFIPTNANTWTSAVFKMKENGDGSFTYWGATGDFFLGAAGRSAIDVWKVTLPAPPRPFGQGGGGGQGDATTGGGWLTDKTGKKINFGFSVKRTGSGLQGNLQLNHKSAEVKIDLEQVSFLGAVGMACGSVAESGRSLELHGTGTFNGGSASFRVCVQDNGEPGSSAGNQDRFYVACTSGCTYDTGTRSPDDAVGGGNIQVRRSTPSGSTTAGASTLILDPVLLTTGIVGQTQLFSVRAYDGNQNPLANASISLTRTTATGVVSTVSAVTSALGVASFPVVVGFEPAEYVASAGTARSNAVEVVPGS